MSKLDKIYAEAEFKPYVDRIKELEAKVESANEILANAKKFLDDIDETHLRTKDVIAMIEDLQECLSQEPLICDKSKEPPCHLEPSKELCQKCELNKTSVANGENNNKP